MHTQDRQAAWTCMFRFSLDEHPDGEIAWEAATWRAWGVTTAAAIADEVLAERRAADFTIPGGADAEDLDRLLSRVELGPILRMVADEGQCLVAALRLAFWAGLRRAER